ncbi:zinc-binding alcohol dehydrogenase family protein [Streptomyces sp. NPDC006333]|uniref:zinc-binding alcohol dehydrogenase family protein n=1 Tax=Streptomyces sp. NPDC006333 TaxID=3156753 RepID=UPI0033B4078E
MNATSMRAVGYRRSLPVSDQESLIDLELPVPEPGPYDLLVKVEAVALNPVDYKVRQNTDPAGEAKVLGWDAAGSVVAVGEKVRRFAVGDDVYYAGAIDRPGANSEYHTVDERIAARKPSTLSFTESAALPLTSLTAWEGLFERLGLENGGMNQQGALLITAAAGGVGAMVAQLARALTSLTVIGTASRQETIDFATRMGVQHVVNHHKPLAPQLAEVAPEGVTHVFSTTNTDRNLPDYAEALRPFGRIVAIDDHESLPLGLLKPKCIAFHWEFMFTRSLFQTPDQDRQHHILTQVARLADAGILRTTATKDLGPVNAANLREAHGILESGSAIGKITLTGF